MKPKKDKPGKPPSATDHLFDEPEPPTTISKHDAITLLSQNFANMQKKVANGKTLPASELVVVKKILEGDNLGGFVESKTTDSGKENTFAKNQVELAEILKVDRRTVQRWLKKPGCPGKSSNGRYKIPDWKQFAKLQGHDTGDSDGDGVTAKDQNIRLQNEKLLFQLKVLKKEYVSSAEVEQWGASLGGEIRKTVVSIHKIASSLAGLTPAEIEIRLKELEDEILMKLHLLAQRTDEMKEAASED